jgi:hypothetical protein
MRARIVPAAQGARWLISGWRLFRVAPLGWLAATLAYWLLMSIASLVPFVGGAVAVVLVPAFTVGFMALARAADRGGTVQLSLLFDGFRHYVRSQLILGAIYLGAFAAVLGASAAADGGTLAGALLAGRRPAQEALDEDGMLAAAAIAAAAYLPVMAAFWFAPALAAWHATGALKALFFSFFGCLLNWRALLAYGSLVALVAMALPFAALNLLALAGANAAPLAAPLALALIVFLLPLLFASFYASYRDVFGYHPPE